MFSYGTIALAWSVHSSTYILLKCCYISGHSIVIWINQILGVGHIIGKKGDTLTVCILDTHIKEFPLLSTSTSWPTWFFGHTDDCGAPLENCSEV